MPDGLGFLTIIGIVYIFGIAVIGFFCSFIFIKILIIFKNLLHNDDFFVFSKTFYFYIVCFFSICISSCIIVIMFDMTFPYLDDRERFKLLFFYLNYPILRNFNYSLFIQVFLFCLIPSLLIYILIRLKYLKKISFNKKNYFTISKRIKFILSVKVFFISLVFFLLSFFVYFMLIVVCFLLIVIIISTLVKLANAI